MYKICLFVGLLVLPILGFYKTYKDLIFFKKWLPEDRCTLSSFSKFFIYDGVLVAKLIEFCFISCLLFFMIFYDFSFKEDLTPMYVFSVFNLWFRYPIKIPDLLNRRDNFCCVLDKGLLLLEEKQSFLSEKSFLMLYRWFFLLFFPFGFLVVPLFSFVDNAVKGVVFSLANVFAQPLAVTYVIPFCFPIFKEVRLLMGDSILLLIIDVLMVIYLCVNVMRAYFFSFESIMNFLYEKSYLRQMDDFEKRYSLSASGICMKIWLYLSVLLIVLIVLFSC